jgi:hypothetical protein
MDESLKFRNLAKYIALAFGVFLIGAETLRNWGEWPRWQSYAFDYGFAVLLIILSVTIHRTEYLALSFMVIIWSLTILLFTRSLIGHLKNINEPTYGLIEQIPLTIGIGVLDLVAVVGIIFTVMAIYKTLIQAKPNGP